MQSFSDWFDEISLGLFLLSIDYLEGNVNIVQILLKDVNL